MITRSERRWLFGFILAVLVITTIPYLVGFNSENEAWEFSGFVFGVEDGNSYLAKMISGSSGAWLFKTPYTAYPQNGVIAFTPYLLLGKLIASPELHDQAAVLFHLFRWIAVSFEIIVIYLFITLYIENPTWRKYALVLATLGGGLGWVLVGIGRQVWFDSLPLDVISPETFGFLELYGLPHLALARGLLFFGLWAFLVPKAGFQPFKSESMIVIAGAAAWIGLVLVQPVTALIGWFLVGVHLGFRGLWVRVSRANAHEMDNVEWKQHLKRGLGLIAASAPLIIYLAAAYLTDPFLGTWGTQNRIMSPHPWHYAAAYGWIAPLVVLGGRSFFRKSSFQSHFLLSWVVCLPFLVYAPTNIQRRLPEGIWVALVILAVVAMQKAGRHARFLQAGVLVLSIPTTLILLVGGVQSASTPSSPQFIAKEASEAYNYMAEHAPSQGVVLSSFRTGNELPAFAPIHVMIGHGPEIANGTVLEEKIKRFFQSETTDEDRLHLLQEFDVHYVVWGPHERAMGDWNPKSSANLERVFTNPSYTIFQVLMP